MACGAIWDMFFLIRNNFNIHIYSPLVLPYPKTGAQAKARPGQPHRLSLLFCEAWATQSQAKAGASRPSLSQHITTSCSSISINDVGDLVIGAYCHSTQDMINNRIFNTVTCKAKGKIPKHQNHMAFSPIALAHILLKSIRQAIRVEQRQYPSKQLKSVMRTFLERKP